MANILDKNFDKVYNKLIKVIDIKTKDIFSFRQIGISIDYKNIKLLNLYLRYLNSIKNSKYEYLIVDGLDNIYKYLNTL